MTIVLISLTNPEHRIELRGEFAEDDAVVLLRTFPELRKSKQPDQMALFDLVNERDWLKEVEEAA